MIQLIEVKNLSVAFYELLALLVFYSEIIFSSYQNPVAFFLDGFLNKKNIPIAAYSITQNSKEYFGFVVLCDFKKISDKNFTCSFYGGAKRGFALQIEQSLLFILDDLKLKGCKGVWIETKKNNRPMRHLAQRLGFRKVGEKFAAGMEKGNLVSNIIYEKVL
ncbi:MAG: hypothetical protein PHX18_00140 [Candidatus Gastranaerophilales bacterium]|nr:hypothetical protein [Candidatus Gastranaerophilales bacterium]